MRILRHVMLLPCLAASPVMAADSSDAISALLTQSTPMAVAFMLSVTAIKITAFILGYLIVKMGHDTLIRGVSGDIDFGFEGSGFKTKLKAGSPGALFIVAGAAIIIWGLTVERPMGISLSPSQQAAAETKPAVTENTSTPNRREVPL